ncbi:DUF6438 domain-containing protein [Pontibacter mangrovi]|uniref:DUF6438 domain-containing protein n=1 Tax=Pontibacter mangrovi TaxID=2589816 RepID=A0A501VXC9_9BACT|nr:DUF6438 domain-containing protein [Pontibacter mangrovi]TPE41065.1 hypothetical protein FJM65_19685 [Pontibacter mangrovi]
MKNFLLYFLPFLIMACHAKKEEPTAQERQLQEQLIGDWVPAGFVSNTENVESYDRNPFRSILIERGYSFYPNGEVDSKQGYYRRTVVGEDEWDNRQFYFLGSKTKYKIAGDSLLIFMPYDSVWAHFPIARLTKDTLSFKEKRGVNNYRRVKYNLKEAPTLDAIVLSTSGCFGTCPISNTLITADGQVVFFGEEFTTSEGFYTGTITQDVYKQLQDNYRKAGIDTISAEFSEAATDLEKVSVTFLKDGKIFKTVSDYGNAGPVELIWAHVPLRYLYQSINLNKLKEEELPVYLKHHFLTFAKGDKTLELTQSEGFLLWNYLRQGQRSLGKYKPRFSMHFRENYLWVPRGAKKYADKEHIKSIETDGQFYTFYLQGQEPFTINIGFNFFDVNFNEAAFTKKDKYGRPVE